MKKLLCIILVLSIFAGLFSVPVLAATNTTVTFNLSASRPIPKAIHGVNTNWYGFLPITQSVTQQAIKNLDFAQIRFPGGTVGNYYDWENFTPDWELINSLPNVPGNITGLKPRYDFHIRELSPLIFDPIIRSMNKEATYVLNFSYNTNEEIIIGLNQLKTHGITPKRLEFGNELYFRAAQGLTPETYVQRAEIINNKAKQLWSGVKTALVVDRKLWRSAANNEPWNIPNRPWYDAVIIHSYSVFGSNTWDSYVPWASGTETDAGSRRRDFADFIARITSAYPGKELWLTEWDIAEFEDHFANTYAQTYYVYDFLLGALQYPVITVANHHSLNDIYQIKAAMRAQYFDPAHYASVPNNQYSVDQFFVKRASFWPLSWIGKAFNRYNRFSIGTASSIRAVYFYNSGNPGKGSLALINTTANTVKPAFSGVNFDTQQVNVSTLTYPWNAKSTENAQFTPTTTTKSPTEITIPAYAIAYLSPSGTPTSNPADLTDEDDKPGDQVNEADYNLLLSDFGKTGSPGWIPADINDDGTVDEADYNILVGAFGE